MNKLSSTSYRALFFKHVFRFLGNVTNPIELAQKHAVAVSGGLDSMVLLWTAQQFYKQGKIGPIRALFVHHHTREGQDLDAQLIKEFCEAQEIPFKILHAFGLNAESGNFENLARRQRRQLLLSELTDNEHLWLGHHIDDSYEWSIMQRYRSSQPKSSLGIPVRNGKIIRPFMCVTRDQIRSLSRFENITYIEDPSNKNTRYDRNFLRHELVPFIKKRYPKYLKHYVNHANYLAVILHLNITNRVDGSLIHAYENGAIIQGRQFSQYQIQELLHAYSNAERGEISGQILKMLKAIDNQKKGPFHFSGGTEIYYSYHLLMIYQQKMKNHDEIIARVLATMSDKEMSTLPDFAWKDLRRNWENLVRQPDAMLSMPGLILIYERGYICKVLNASVYDPLFPKVSQICQSRNFCFVTTLKCLDHWKKKKNKLPEKLKLLPLWTLANLFPSQG